MSGDVVLAIDQGTTNTKVVAVDRTGAIVAQHSEPVPIAFPRPGWVESDGAEVWATVTTGIAAVIDQLGGRQITGVGVSNQRETVVAWDPTSGDVLGPAVSWQCTRGAELCRAIATPETERLVLDTTGLPLDPMFSASKVRWLFDHVPDAGDRAADGGLVIATIDAWLAWNLTGGTALATDLTNASRTALLDRRTRQWSPPMLDAFGIPSAVLPTVHASSHSFGRCRIPGLEDVLLGSLIGDSHAALVGHGALEPGSVKASFGTGTSVMAPIASDGRAPAGLATSVGWSADVDGGRRVVDAAEGNIYATGAALEWTATLLGVDVAELEPLARSCTDTGGVQLVPAFSGLAAPHWQPDARGVLVGLTRASGRAEVARAAFEAVAHQVADVIDALMPSAGPPRTVFVDGGAMRSDLLATAVADLTGLTIRRADTPEMAALGAALLAGVSAAWWTMQDLDRLVRPGRVFEPTLDDHSRAARRADWREAISQAVSSGGREAR